MFLLLEVSNFLFDASDEDASMKLVRVKGLRLSLKTFNSVSKTIVSDEFS